MWRGWWWSQETGLDKAASLLRSDVPKRFAYLTEEKRGGEKRPGWFFAVGLVHFRDEHVKRQWKNPSRRQECTKDN